MNDVGGHHRQFEDRLRALVDKTDGGSPVEPLFATIVQLMFEQNATLGRLEAFYLELRNQVHAFEERRSASSPGAESVAISPLTATVIRGKRWSDKCSFCGRGASEILTVYSSPKGAHICSGCIDTFNSLRT